MAKRTVACASSSSPWNRGQSPVALILELFDRNSTPFDSSIMVGASMPKKAKADVSKHYAIGLAATSWCSGRIVLELWAAKGSLAIKLEDCDGPSSYHMRA